jgi:predicted translin family RNA/ssDNA-binding protein
MRREARGIQCDFKRSFKKASQALKRIHELQQLSKNFEECSGLCRTSGSVSELQELAELGKLI